MPKLEVNNTNVIFRQRGRSISMTRGLLITFEGIDGCGKTLQSQLLYEWLLQKGQAACLTCQPGGSSLGRGLRQLLLENGQEQINDAAEVLLFAADRAQHVSEVIKPALNAGKIVICDRYIDSFIAYQGGGRGISIAILEALNDFSLQGCLPDVTFYLEISLDVAMGRWKGVDRIEQEDQDFYLRVKSAYDQIAEQNRQRIITLEAERTPSEIFADIKAVVEEKLIKCMI
jgi:dTMP kinase